MSAEKIPQSLCKQSQLKVNTTRENRLLFKAAETPNYDKIIKSEDTLKLQALENRMNEALAQGMQATAELREQTATLILEDFGKDRAQFKKDLESKKPQEITAFIKGKETIDTPDDKGLQLNQLSAAEMETFALFLEDKNPEMLEELANNLDQTSSAVLMLSDNIKGETKAALAGIKLENGSYKIKLDGTKVDSSFTKTAEITDQFKNAKSKEEVLLAFMKDLDKNPKKLTTGDYAQRNEVMSKMIADLEGQVQRNKESIKQISEAAEAKLPTQQEADLAAKKAEKLTTEKAETQIAKLLENNTEYTSYPLKTPRATKFNDAEKVVKITNVEPTVIKHLESDQQYFLYESPGDKPHERTLHLIAQVGGVDTKLASISQLSELPQLLKTIDKHVEDTQRRERYNQKLTERMKHVRQGNELPDWTNNIEIAENDPKLNDLISSSVDDETWNNTYNNKLNSTIRYNSLLKGLGVQNPAQVMKDAINMGISDSSIDAGDLLEATGLDQKYGDADQFRERYTYLLKSVGNASSTEEKQELHARTKIYDSITEIISLLNAETLQETKTLSTNTEKYELTLESLSTTTETPYENKYFSLDQLATDKFSEASTNQAEYRIGLSQSVLKDFEARYHEMNLEQKPYTDAQALTLLLRVYGVEGLLKHSQKTQENPKNIVITSLPENFKTGADVNFAQAFAHLQDEHMGGEDPSWSDVDAPSAAEVHQSKVTKLRENFDKSVDTVRGSLSKTFDQLQQSDAYEVESILDDLVAGASPQEKQYLGEQNLRDYVEDRGARLLSPEGIVDILTGEAELGIKNEKPIYKVEDNGLLTLDSAALLQRMNFFLQRTDKTAELITNPNQVSPTQASLIRKGIGRYLIREKAKEDLTVSRKSAELEKNISAEQYQQLRGVLEQSGYPQDQLDSVPSRVKIGLALAYKYGEHMSISGGVLIPVGESFGVAVDAAFFRDPNAGISFGKIHRINEDTQFIGGARLGISESGFSSAAFAGIRTKLYSNPETFYDTYLTAGVYADLSQGISVGGTVGVDKSFNEKVARNATLKQKLQESGLLKVSQETDPQAKVDLLREITRYQEVEGELADEDLLTLHYIDMEDIAAQATAESIPTFTRMGIGVIAGINVDKEDGVSAELGVAAGIEVRIGNRTVTLISHEARKNLTQQLTNDELNRQLAEQKNLTFRSASSTEQLVYDDQGRLKIAKKAENERAITSNFEGLKTAFRKANILLQKETVEGKTLLQINVLNPRGTVEIVAQGEDYEILEKDGKAYLAAVPGKPFAQSLTAARSRVNNVIADRNGVNSVDTIFLTSKPGPINFQEIYNDSKVVLRSTIQNGLRTALTPVQGVDYKNEKSTIQPLENRIANTPSFKETTNGIPAAEYQEYQAMAESIKHTPDEHADYMRPEWEQTSKSLYSSMEKQLNKGNPPISDFQALLKAVEKQLEARNRNHEMTQAEKTTLIQVFQHLYFVNLWKKGGKKAVLKRFDQHNESIRDSVLAPKVTAIIKNLGLNTEGRSSRDITQALIAQNRAQFEIQLDQIKDISDIKANPIPAGWLYSPGTFIREGKKSPLLPVSISGGKAVDGYAKLGIIGETIDYAKDEDPVMHRILLELQNPTPSPEDPKTLESPFTQRILSIPEVGHHLGKAKYKALIDKVNGDVDAVSKDVIAELATIANALRETGEFTLKNGTTLEYGSQAETASYAQCGNFTILSTEAIKITDSQGQAYYAVEGHDLVIPEEQLTSAGLAIPVGILAKFKIKPDKTNKPEAPKRRGRGAEDGENAPDSINDGGTVPVENDNGTTDIRNSGAQRGARG